MYLEVALSYAANVATFDMLLMMLLGIASGLVIGAIPGLSPPMAIALMIPVSFHLPAEQALVLMVSCYAAGIYGGSFSAILLRAPGTSASAASSIEGFELTKRGKAIEAIRISTFASVVGGLLSGFALLIFAPPLAQVSLFIGPAEYFLIALLGLTAIASVSFGNVGKGLISGFFGLFLATVGIDIHSGFPRFAFGSAQIAAGIDIMPAIIGLFAFAQGLQLCSSRAHDTIAGVKQLSWNLMPKWSEIMYVRWSLIRGWICGLGLGLIPAAGASVAQWLAYAWEIRRAKEGDQFGEGEIKGLAATEGSNNGSTGTSLIPMFVLGIPGGISAAVILGALVIHGLQPGMRLFAESPDVIYTVIWGFIFANILMGVIAIFMARGIAYLTIVPTGIIAPMILVFCIVGTFANTGNFFDVWLMIGFGVLGYYMYKHNFSPAGMLLGLILGPIAENGFRNMMVVSGGDPIMFLAGRPISLVLIASILIVLYYSFKQPDWKAKAEDELDAVVHEHEHSHEAGASSTVEGGDTTGNSGTR